MLDDDDGVAEVAQTRERREQLPVVALMQADRRLVEHVQHAGQVRADLRREADALSFAARERCRAAAEREIADADVVKETEPLLDLAQDALGDDRFAIGECKAVENLARLRKSAGRRSPQSSGPSPRTDRLCALQPLSRGTPGTGAATGTASRSACPTQLPSSSRRRRFGGRIPSKRGVREVPAGPPIKISIALLLRQLAERHRRGRCRGRGRASAAPRAPASCRPAPTARSRHRRATSISSGTTRRGSKSIIEPRPWHIGAGAMRRVEREGARRHLGHAHAAIDARQAPREQPVAARRTS